MDVKVTICRILALCWGAAIVKDFSSAQSHQAGQIVILKTVKTRRDEKMISFRPAWLFSCSTHHQG